MSRRILVFNSFKRDAQAGVLEEMLEDTLEMDEDEELEEEADAEVDKVLFELTNGKLGVVGAVGTELPVRLYHPGPTNEFKQWIANADQTGGRRDRKNHGEIPSTIEWTLELIRPLCCPLFIPDVPVI